MRPQQFLTFKTGVEGETRRTCTYLYVLVAITEKMSRQWQYSLQQSYSRKDVNDRSNHNNKHSDDTDDDNTSRTGQDTSNSLSAPPSLRPLPVPAPLTGHLQSVRFPRHHLQLCLLRIGSGRVQQGEVPELLLFPLYLRSIRQEPAGR